MPFSRDYQMEGKYRIPYASKIIRMAIGEDENGGYVFMLEISPPDDGGNIVLNFPLSDLKQIAKFAESSQVKIPDLFAK